MKKNIQQKPKLRLSNCNGNAFSLVVEGIRVLKRSGATQDEIKQFETEAISGNYDHLIQTLLGWFDVQQAEEEGQ